MRRRSTGQAAVELLAAVPAILLASLLAWQLAAVIRAGLEAQERARAAALHARSRSGSLVTRRVTVKVPGFLPGIADLEVPGRAAVRAP